MGQKQGHPQYPCFLCLWDSFSRTFFLVELTGPEYSRGTSLRNPRRLWNPGVQLLPWNPKNPQWNPIWETLIQDDRMDHQHSTQGKWPPRGLLSGHRFLMRHTLVPVDKSIIRTLYIKLQLMKQFAKALRRGNSCLECMVWKLPALSLPQLSPFQANVPNGPQI